MGDDKVVVLKTFPSMHIRYGDRGIIVDRNDAKLVFTVHVFPKNPPPGTPSVLVVNLPATVLCPAGELFERCEAATFNACYIKRRTHGTNMMLRNRRLCEL